MPEQKTQKVRPDEKALQWKIEWGHLYTYPVWLGGDYAAKIGEYDFIEQVDVYSTNLYKNVDGRWVKWMTVEQKIVDDPRIHMDIEWFPQIFWKSGKYIFISNYLPKESGGTIYRAYGQIIKLYKIDIEERAVKDSFIFSFIDKGYSQPQQVSPVVPPSNIMKDGDAVVIVMPDRSQTYTMNLPKPSVKLIRIDEKDLQKTRCYLVAESYVKAGTDIVSELHGNKIRLKWEQFRSGETFHPYPEKSFDFVKKLDEFKEIKC